MQQNGATGKDIVGFIGEQVGHLERGYIEYQVAGQEGPDESKWQRMEVKDFQIHGIDADMIIVDDLIPSGGGKSKVIAEIAGDIEVVVISPRAMVKRAVEIMLTKAVADARWVVHQEASHPRHTNKHWHRKTFGRWA